MKNIRLRRIYITSFMLFFILSLNQSIASAEWRISTVETRGEYGELLKSEGKMWYAEGDSWATGWRNIDNKWYYFDLNTGYTVKGWNYINNNWYYFIKDGFYHPLVTNSFIGDRNYANKYYYVNSDGAYIENPKGEIGEYMKLLNDSDRMRKMGILSNTKVSGFSLSERPNYINDYVCGVKLTDEDNDGISEIEISSIGYKKSKVVYLDGQFYVNGQAISDI